MSGKRPRTLSSKAADENNVADPAISAHQRPAKKTKTSTTTEGQQPSTSTTTSTPAPSVIDIEDAEANDNEDAQGGQQAQIASEPSTSINISDSEGSEEEEAAPRLVKTKDVTHFFPEDKQFGNKKKRKCSLCQRKGVEKWIVAEPTTIRRHLESSHKAAYYIWADKNGFASMLPSDRKAEKDAKAAENAKQSTLDPHLREAPPKPRVVKYSDAAFKQAAAEWLAATDQPLSALSHPKFREMIDIASRAEDGVIIPSDKEIRQALLDLFKVNLINLKKRLNSDKVGEVSLTCDAWQASNTDAYFAVTGHWIEETAPLVWTEHSALLGFTRMNTSHDGVRLGRALFRVVRRVGIITKVGWVTCDNATNNNTMLRHFELLLNAHHSRRSCPGKWDHRSRHIRCLAHVINLATQAVLTTYSKAKHFDPANPDEHEPDVFANSRDEVGLIRAVAVKVRSSAKRKELFLNLQGEKPLTMKLDMPVRWSSSYEMLQRALALEKHVNEFLFRIAREEKDAEKRSKLQGLALRQDEWKRAQEFTNLLSFANDAQQSFSTDNYPSLQYGLPALEALHTAWSTCSEMPKYARYSAALQAGIDKISDYYDRTATSHAYTFAMILDPEQKLSHFASYWPADLRKQVRDDAEKMFMERHILMYGNVPRPLNETSRGNKKMRRLLQNLARDNDNSPEAQAAPSTSPPNTAELAPAPTTTDSLYASKPWLKEFNRYLDSEDELDDKTTIVQWWGVNSHRYPVWASLARDHLAIMGSSVSSERAFSAAGITISKRRNRLKGDIVEALQFIKCSIRKDLLYREEVVSLTEEELVMADDGDPEWEDVKEKGWDEYLIDGDDSDDNESN